MKWMCTKGKKKKKKVYISIILFLFCVISLESIKHMSPKAKSQIWFIWKDGISFGSQGEKKRIEIYNVNINYICEY